MSTVKPAIVIVPGAWQVPSHYALLYDSLTANGYEVTTCAMPSSGPPEPFPDASQDIAVVRNALQSYIDRGLDVVIIMHSIGGIIGSSACKGHRPTDHTNGKGVVLAIYLTAFAMPEGVALLNGPDAKHVSWIRLSEHTNGLTWAHPDNPPHKTVDIIYNDCTPTQQAAALEAAEQNYSDAVNWSPCEYAAWKEIESAYLICELDNAIPVEFQEIMASQEGGKWKRVERIGAGHSPFISKPGETAAFVKKCIEDIY